MSGNIFAVGQMSSLMFGVGKTLLQSKKNSEEIGYVDNNGG